MSGVAALGPAPHLHALAGSGCLLRASELGHGACGASGAQPLPDFPSPAQSLTEQAGLQQQARPTKPSPLTCIPGWRARRRRCAPGTGAAPGAELDVEIR